MTTAPSAPLRDEVEHLYSHHGWLYKWLHRKLGNSAEAEDLAHDVYLRILRRAEPPRAVEPRAFLSTIARRVVIDHWRRRELEQAWLDALAALPEASTPSPEARAEILQTLAAIDHALDGLKPAARSAFLWNQLEGLTCRQIAERLGVSLATVERYVAQALRLCYCLRYES